MSYAIHTLRVVFYDISCLKYIHFFNLLTKTKNEELEHNLPSHPMPHPPQPQSSTDFAKPGAFLKNWNRDEDPAMEPAQQLPHGNIKESRLHVTSQADAARNNPWFFA